MSFFEELKRRNVFRVGIAYAVSAWVLLQVMDLVLDNTDTPEWVMDVFMLVAVLGLLVALIVAWAFEITPEGIKREEDVVRDPAAEPRSARKLDYITLAAVALVIALLAMDRLIPETVQPEVLEVAAQTTQAPATSTPSASSQPEHIDSLAPSPGEGEIVLGVAVLPFENLSADANNAFFAGGVHEDVLTHVSRITGLRVISRTSMVRIAERQLDVREIGQQLGVSHVLEGSVRRSGEQVRVTVQLIDAATDEHIWANNYDRTLDDIFVIQSEIARSIAAQLETELSPEAVERINETPTDNLAAYDLYLKAMVLNQTWRGAEGFKDQRELLEQAVALDPEFLPALAMLASAYGRLVWADSDPDGTIQEKAETLTATIQQTWPERPEAAYVQAVYAYTVERDYESALTQFSALLPEMPNNVDLLTYISSCYKRLGRYEEGLLFARKAVSLDPEDASAAGEVGFHLAGTKQASATITYMQDLVARFPDDVSGLYSLAFFSLALMGDEEAFFNHMARVDELGGSSALLTSSLDNGLLVRLLQKRDGTDAALARLNRDPAINPFQQLIDAKNAAVVLRLAGREEDSRLKAQSALHLIEQDLAAGWAPDRHRIRLAYAEMAYLACLAGDNSNYLRYAAITRTLPAMEMLEEEDIVSTLGFTEAECGEPDKGFELIQELVDNSWTVTPWAMALDPLFAHYFADLAEYKQVIERLGAP